ncbi:hypothetical protein ACA910_015823 [Epithemia clementina (nom. ined.)]
MNKLLFIAYLQLLSVHHALSKISSYSASSRATASTGYENDLFGRSQDDFRRPLFSPSSVATKGQPFKPISSPTDLFSYQRSRGGVIGEPKGNGLVLFSKGSTGKGSMESKDKSSSKGKTKSGKDKGSFDYHQAKMTKHSSKTGYGKNGHKGWQFQLGKSKGKGKGLAPIVSKGKGKGFLKPTPPPLTRKPSRRPPTRTPTRAPTATPTISIEPSQSRPPSHTPTTTPTHFPSARPSNPPTRFPTTSPSFVPSQRPSFSPSTGPSESPTWTPSVFPSSYPTQTAHPSSSSEQPTVAPSVTPQVVPASPFAVIYTLAIAGADPTPEEFAEAADLTLTHIDQFLTTTFASIPETSYLGQASFPTSTGIDPVTIDYGFTALFADNSQEIPNASELDQLIEESLSDPAVNNLTDSLRALSGSNPFSTTETVSYAKISNAEQQASNSMVNYPTASPTSSIRSSYFFAPAAAPATNTFSLSQPVSSPLATDYPESPVLSTFSPFPTVATDVPTPAGTTLQPSGNFSIPPILEMTTDLPTLVATTTQPSAPRTLSLPPQPVMGSENRSSNGSTVNGLVVVSILVILLGLIALWILELRQPRWCCTVSTAKASPVGVGPSQTASLLRSARQREGEADGESTNLVYFRDDSEASQSSHSAGYSRRKDHTAAERMLRSTRSFAND